MPSNIAATSPGCLSRSARVTLPTLRGTVLATGGRPPWHPLLQQRRTLPFLAEDVLGEEGEDGLVPDPRVARGEDPVVLVREVQELGLHPVPGQVPPQPQRF